MPEYEIKRWDAVIEKNNTIPFPMVYIKPDQQFENDCQKNNNIFVVKISETDSEYDKIPVTAFAKSSKYFPQFRPNFYDQTGYYAIVLHGGWLGYPDKNGKISLLGSSDIINEEPVKENFQDNLVKSTNLVEPKTECKNNNKMNYVQLNWILILILIVFCVLFVISIKKN
jgi:hypothetical protein